MFTIVLKCFLLDLLESKKETTSIFSQIYQGLDGLIMSQGKNKHVEV